MLYYSPFTTSTVVDTETQRHTFLRWDVESTSSIYNRKFKSIWNSVNLYKWDQYRSNQNYRWDRYNSTLTYRWLTYPVQLWYRWTKYQYVVTRSVWDVWTPGWGVGVHGNPDYAGQVTCYGPGPPSGNYAKVQLVYKYGGWDNLGVVESISSTAYSGSSQLPSYPSHNQIAYVTAAYEYRKSSTVSNGNVTSTSSSTYENDGYNSSIGKWTIYDTSYYVQGGYVTQVVTSSSSSYTSGTRNSDGYWYIYAGMYYTCGASTGTLVKSIDINAYPTNGRSSYDGYWYIKK